jgi:SAM-dependent methyltransferase
MSVSPDDVRLAYRWILGRSASDQEISAWLNTPSADVLRNRFLTSTEFGAVISTMLKSRPPIPLNSPPLEIDVHVDDITQQRLIDRISRAWTALGSEEPHWSVLSADKFKSAQFDKNREAFYASGQFDADRIMMTLNRHNIDADRLRRVCEYGCGVGRVTPYIAKIFKHVLAIDISTTHLDLAKNQADGCSNVEFVLAKLPHAGMSERFDLWFSHIVLQHNPPPVIAMILQRMFSMLSRGGVSIFQVPTYSIRYSFDVNKYLSTPEAGNIEIHCLPQQEVFRLARQAGCVPLEVIEDASLPYPWLSQVFVFQKIGASEL